MRTYKITKAIILSLMIYSCGVDKNKRSDRPDESLSISNVENRESAPLNKDNKVVDSLRLFVDYFKEVDLPIEISKTKPDAYKDFLSLDKEISRNQALKFLFNGDSSRLIQPTGGYYKFYYGYRIKTGLENIYTLLYLRSSYDCYSGIVASTFLKDGGNISSIFIAGDSLDFGQIESFIQKDLTLNIVESVIDMKSEFIVGKFSGIKRIQSYELHENGKIILAEDSLLQNQCFVLKDSPIMQIASCSEQ
jgi:hypothetical protein